MVEGCGEIKEGVRGVLAENPKMDKRKLAMQR